MLSWAGLELDDFVHDLSPGAHGDLRIAGAQVGAGDLHVQLGQAGGFVHGVKEPCGLSLVPGLEAFAVAGLVVEGVVNTPTAPEEPVTVLQLFHGFRE